jgi:hypothetical protein
LPVVPRQWDAGAVRPGWTYRSSILLPGTIGDIAERIIKNSKIMNMKQAFLYVERDDSEYDYRSGFKSYTEANEYRVKCQRSWINHCDYVYLWTVRGVINLTKMKSSERNEILKQYHIPE